MNPVFPVSSRLRRIRTILIAVAAMLFVAGAVVQFSAAPAVAAQPTARAGAVSPFATERMLGHVAAATADAALGLVAADGAQIVAAEQERVAAEQAAAEAAALAQSNSPEGAQETARVMAADRYGWGDDQFGCLVSLWNKESGWNYQAYNASSGATGIPQALPGSKMASAGDDWQTNAATQISWGLDYISRAYGTPCSAWGHSQATNWY